MAGRIIALARRGSRRAPMEVLSEAEITTEVGLVEDHKGARFPKRQVTVLSLEDWHAALDDLGLAHEALDWTARRANVLVQGLRLPRVKGARLGLGDAELEVTGETVPCHRMDEAHEGLRKALASKWRGGLTLRVVRGGRVSVGAPVTILLHPPETVRRLP